MAADADTEYSDWPPANLVALGSAPLVAPTPTTVIPPTQVIPPPTPTKTPIPLRVIVEGAPNMTLELEVDISPVPELGGVSGGHLAVAMSAVRAIPYVLKAPPGVVRPEIFGAYRWRSLPQQATTSGA